MRTVIWFAYFWGYLFVTLFMKMKLHFIKKRGNEKEVEEYIHYQASRWARAVVSKTGSQITVVGNENIPKETCLFVGNHQGNFDIPLMIGYVNKPLGFVAKKEVEKLPIIRSWMGDLHCIFMDRSNPRESVKAINEGIENLRKGYSMVIFPEGTRSKGGAVGEFKQGSMKLAIKAEVPIIPVTIDGSYKLMEANGNWIKPGTVKVTLSKPIYTKNLTKEEQGNLAQKVRQIIIDNLEGK